MQTAPAIPGLLSQSLVMHYAANWLQVLEAPAAPALQQCFALAGAGAATGAAKLRFVSFSVRRMVQLVSTVGAVHIKASFLAQPVLAPKNPCGAAATYAR